MLVLMLFGSLIPLTTFICPALAGFLLVPTVREWGRHSGLCLYAAVAFLSLFLVADKEVALLFILLLGPYPLLQPIFQKLPLILAVICKLIVFNLLLLLTYGLLLFVLMPTVLVAEFNTYSSLTLLVLLILANLTFSLYDLLLSRFSRLYETRFQTWLFHPRRNKK